MWLSVEKFTEKQLFVSLKDFQLSNARLATLGRPNQERKRLHLASAFGTDAQRSYKEKFIRLTFSITECIGATSRVVFS